MPKIKTPTLSFSKIFGIKSDDEKLADDVQDYVSQLDSSLKTFSQAKQRFPNEIDPELESIFSQLNQSAQPLRDVVDFRARTGKLFPPTEREIKQERFAELDAKISQGKPRKQIATGMDALRRLVTGKSLELSPREQIQEELPARGVFPELIRKQEKAELGALGEELGMERQVETPTGFEAINQLREAGRRGAASFELDLEAYDALTDKTASDEILSKRKEFQKKSGEQPATLRESGLLGRAAIGVAETLPGMIKGFSAGLPTAVAATSAALPGILAAGSAGPQIVSPVEEIVGLGSVFAAGLATGSTLLFFKQGAGQFYSDMREDGVSHETASLIGQLAAMPYALIEVSQMSKIIPGLREGLNAAVRGSAKEITKQLVTRFGVNWAEQVGEEVLQEVVGIVAEEVGKKIDSITDSTTLSEAMKRLWATGVDAGLTFGLLQLPGAAIQTTTSFGRVDGGAKPTEAPGAPAPPLPGIEPAPETTPPDVTVPAEEPFDIEREGEIAEKAVEKEKALTKEVKEKPKGGEQLAESRTEGKPAREAQAEAKAKEVVLGVEEPGAAEKAAPVTKAEPVAEKVAPEPPTAAPALNVTFNDQSDRIELKFPQKPSEDVISSLRKAGFTFSRKKQQWVAKDTAGRRAIVEGLRKRLAKQQAVGARGAVPVTKATSQPTRAESKVSDKLNDFIEKAINQERLEESGRARLDELEDADASPRKIGNTFWNTTFDKLPEKGKKRFIKIANKMTGVDITKPGGLTILKEDFIGDFPDKIENLEPADRGFVVLMDEATRLVVESEVPAEKAALSTKFELTGIPGEKPQGKLELGVQAEVPKGKIKGETDLAGTIFEEKPKVTGKQLDLTKEALPHLTRQEVEDQFIEAFPKVSNEQRFAIFAIEDAKAETFAKWTGLTTQDYYEQNFAEIKKARQKRKIKKGFLKSTKGFIQFLDDGRAIIRAFEGADVSTAIHESAHIARRMLYRARDQALPEFKQQIDADIKALEEWAGVTDGNDGFWTVEQEEKFARGFERFLASGKAPNKQLRAVFQQFKDWLLGIYKTIKGSDIDVKLGKEIRQVFDNLLGGKDVTVKAPAIPLDDVVAQGILLRDSDFIEKDGKRVLTEEMQALKDVLGVKVVNDRGGKSLDEHATDLGITEEELRQQLLGFETPFKRGEKLTEQTEAAQQPALAQEKQEDTVDINDEGELVVNGKVLFQEATQAIRESGEEGQQELGLTSFGEDGLSRYQKFKKSLEKGANVFIEWVQDDWRRVRNLQKTKDILLKDAANPYQREVLFHGRVSARIEDAKEAIESIQKDIVKTAKGLKIDDSELTADVLSRLFLRHAPERNAELGDGAAGITTARAEKFLTDLEAKPYFADIKRISDALFEFHQQTLGILADGEVISKDLLQDLKTKYKFHVPLQRIFEDSENISQILSGRGLDVRGAGLFKAVGSKRKVADIMNNILANYQQAVIRAEKNRVDLSTLRFARENNFMGGLFEEIRPRPKGVTFKGIEKAKAGERLTGADIVLEEIKDPNVLALREKGKQVYLKINDPHLAQALKSVNREQIPKYLRFVATFTRFYSALATRFNPEFVFSNKIRDLQEALVYVAAEGEGAFNVLGKEVRGQSMKAVIEGLAGKDTEGARLYQQMRLDGGTTGGLGLSTRKQVELDVERIRRVARSNPRKAALMFVRGVDKWNKIFEDSTRLSVYRVALERGRTRDQAARLAKEASVNFNKKGKGGPLINALYMFANASIQGSAKMLKAMRNLKVATGVSSVVTAAVWAAAAWNDEQDEDWRDKVSKWDRLNGLNVVLPSSDDKFHYVTIPVSWGLKPIKVAADYLTDFAMNKKRDLGNAVGAILSSVIEGYNPIGGTDFTSAITPTILDLPIDIARNKAWHGNKIRPDWDPFAPESVRYFKSLNKTKEGRLYVAAAEKISVETGGRLEISPEVMEYASRQIVGGAGRFIEKTINTTISLIGKDEVEVRSIPFVSRFYRSKKNEELRDRKVDLLKKLLTEQSRERIKASNIAESIYSEIKKMTDEQGKATILELDKKDPALARRLIRIRKDDKLGLTYPERLMKKLSPEDRAKYIDMILSELSDKDRRSYMAELLRKRLITAEVGQLLDQTTIAASK